MAGTGNPNFGKKPVAPITAPAATTTVAPIIETPTVNTVAEPSIPLSQVKAMLAEMLAEQQKNQVQVSTPQAAPIQQPQFKVQNDINDVPELQGFEMRDRIYILCDNLKPISYTLAKQHTENSPLQYVNKMTQEVIPMRYSTNQVSFFIPNQTKEPGSVFSTDIIFNYGMLKVSSTDILLQKFLEIHPHKNLRFREYDPMEKSRAFIAKKKIGITANALAMNVGELTNRSIASLISPSYTDAWDLELVEEEIYSFIDKDPQKYIDYTNDPTLKAKGIAKTALAKGLMKFSNYKFINDRGEVVLEVAKNTNEFDAIAAYFATGEGRSFYEFLVHAIG